MFLLDILSHRMSVIDSMTMSAPETRVKLVVRKPTKGLGRKEPNMIIIGVRLPPELPTNCFCGYRNRGTAGAATSAP